MLKTRIGTCKPLWKWIQNRWYEFKNGDGGYLRYGLSFSQFILLVYALGIERLPMLSWLFPSLWIFAVSFFCLYSPLAIVIGHIHRQKQVTAETIIAIEQNPVTAYSGYIGICQFILFLKANNIPVLPEYLHLRDYWKKIAKDWKPPNARS